MSTHLKDLELVEKAGFTRDITLVAQTTVTSLHYLKSLSLKLGIPIEGITAEHIIRELAETDSRIRENQQKFDSFVAGKNA